MTVDSWERAQKLFLEAADLPPADLEGFLRLECADDAELRSEVESLLLADRKNGAGIAEVVETEASLMFDSPVPGERLGAYRIVRQIGRGGMGAVYLAMRDDDQYHKKVAIKVVKRGMDTAEVLTRFRYERQILANLDHPYIAGLYDGGTTADGRPFFVMEYVEGQPVDVFCRERSLSADDRCRLFVRICEAVAHAHRNLVVHRDLKPANIFITPEGTPKLLDFGIAKLLGERSGERRTTTRMERHFTPDYASPEQISGRPMTTSSDVYSLGAVLYELLTGRRAHQITGATPFELERAVCEGVIARPRIYSPDLDSDLDNIVLMAMRKEPERRYHSVEQFAEDIQRYLEARPVLARKDSLLYRARRFTQRRRYALAASAAVVLSLVCGIVIAFSQAREARAARRAAEINRDIAVSERQRAELRLGQIVNLSNHSLSEVYGLMEHLPGAMPARREMVNAMLRFLEDISKDAGSDDRLKFTLAKAYLRLGDLQGDPDSPNVGDMAGAFKSFQAAAALLGPPSRTADAEWLEIWADVQNKIGKIFPEKGERATSRKVLQEAIQVLDSMPSTGPSRSKAELYLTLSRSTVDLPRSLELARTSLAEATAYAARFPSDGRGLLLLSGGNTQFGYVQWLMGNPAAADAPYRESIRLREHLVRDHPNDLFYRRYLKLAYEHYAALYSTPNRPNLGRPEIARLYYKKAQPMEEAEFADPQNSLARFDYAGFLYTAAAVDVPPEGLAESLATLRKAAAIFESEARAQPGMHRYQQAMADVSLSIGKRLFELGRYREATAEYTRGLNLGMSIMALDSENQALFVGVLRHEKGIAESLMMAGERSGALDHAHALIRRAESSKKAELRDRWLGDGYFTLAKIYRQFSDCDQATQAAQRSMRLDPNLKADALAAQCSAKAP